MTIPEALNLGFRLHQAGRLAEAEALYRQVLAAQPNHPGALQLLGVISHQVGRHDVAVDFINKSVALEPNNPEAHFNLGQVYRATGRIDEAIAAYRRALLLKPDFPEILNNLGDALRLKGQGDEAVSAYRRALEIRPDLMEAQNNLGNALLAAGRLDEAIAAYRRAVQLKPDFPEIHNNLANALRERRQFDESIAACRRALELRPGYAEAHNNLGAALAEQGRLEEAITAYRCALELKADFPEAHNNLAVGLAALGQFDEAIPAFRRGLRLRPWDASAHSNLIFTLSFHPGYDAGMIAEERVRWNRQFSDPSKPFILPHTNDRNPARRLRIGYVSPDFRDHVVGRNLIPLFERHDRQSFEIACYSGVISPDKLTDRFRQWAQHWRNTVGVGDEALAEMIRKDSVDILVDLAQHSGSNRLPVFARKPAPIQVSFAGYPETTGLETIEYRISDRYLEAGSADDETGKGERICFIDSFWCYVPGEESAEVNGLPASESGIVTFGCLNNYGKVNEQVLDLWARVLGRVTDSRLIMRSPGGSHQRWALGILAKEGVAPDRVEFVKTIPRQDYLELYRGLDIVLDTFPYNGHTTSLDALWMGVSVVSLAGRTPVSRGGLSQLTNLGLSDLAAHSEEDFVRIAAGLAGDLPRLALLRSTLRGRMQNSVLMDAPRFTRQVEEAYRKMWRSWSQQQPSRERTP